MATIGLTPVDRPLDFGVVITRDDGSIDRFLEKPTWGQVFSDTINTGIYVLEPEILELIEPARPVDFSAEVFPQLLEDGRPLYGAVAHGYWEDVGTVDAYLPPTRTCSTRWSTWTSPASRSPTACGWGRGPRSPQTLETVRPAVIGPDCSVESGTRLGAYTVLGSHCGCWPTSTSTVASSSTACTWRRAAGLRGAVVGKT